MKKYFSLLFLITVLTFEVVSTQPGLAADLSFKKTVVAHLKEAKKLTKDGDWLKAQKIYEELLETPGLRERQIKVIREKYEALNFQMLFARSETPGAVFYTVSTGDSLYSIAKKHHTTTELIKKINNLRTDTIVLGRKLKIVTGEFSIKIDKSDNVLELFFDGKPVKRYRVATGANNGTPTGKFKITDKLVNPTWYKVGVVVPPGSPENSLGTRWLGFDLPGYGIHGTTDPDSIGKQVSAGCVRLLNPEVEELYDFVPSGAKVTVVD